MDIETRLKPDPGRIVREIKGDIERGIPAGLLRVLGALEAEAVDLVPRDTDNLANSIRKYLKSKTAGILTATAPYAIFVHEGTGIYGPKKKPFEIRAKDKKALAFTWKGKNIVVQKVTIKGMKPRKFFDKAYKRVQPRMQEIFLGAFKLD